MTDDLIARLRSVDVSWSETGEWCAEAADRIEELETQNEGYKLALAEQLQIRQELEAWKAAEEAHHHMLRGEVERLRGALKLAANRLARNAVDYIAAGDPHAYEQSEWADETLRAALEGTSHE